ncbi:hypothetical protein I8752_26230 [Nostocaceae cyanobacterium CENA369]|uniref:Uncharacterized protein n=1 Tax=Dendronalium phyllosphericum CENA369 TaxID=1725256 RepID=A0A8J7LI09_9NOST|nr:hypothetical protein [Dendronalium phyllosphericum]MBH8576424.1 hypothetical protein [Dendronalium phyllosphericum CENA369]
MKTGRLLTFVPAALAMSLVLTEPILAETPSIQITSKLQSDPLILNGKSGGSVKSDCGNIPNAPSQIIQVSESLPYLRLTVDSPGQPTLLIDGPGGRFCVLADRYSETKPEMSGYWQSGKYALYVGELSQRQYSYTLSISQQQKKGN